MATLTGEPSPESIAVAAVREAFRKHLPELRRIQAQGRHVMRRRQKMLDGIQDPYLRATAEKFG